MAFKRLGDLAGRFLGVNGASGDATNPLSVRGPGSLFDGDTGGHQVRLNKATVGQTVSFLFQRAFSGRAEFGLIGNDDFELKVSPNGSAFSQAYVVDGATAITDFKQPPAFNGQPLYHTGNLPNYALLAGADFTGAVTAASFDGDGSLVTGVNADSLDGFDSTDFVREGTSATLQSLNITNADNAISWENGINWINGNDGGGNAQIRFGNNHGDLNGGGSDEVFTHTGTAYYIGGNLDSGGGTLQLKVATNGGAGIGEAVAWGPTSSVTSVGFSVDGTLTVSGGVAGALAVPDGLGVGGASPDASNQFAFYGTNVLLNSGSSINMKYNKATAGDDASMTFQQGFTTQALFGLLGSNDVTLKVGPSFLTAFTADRTTGRVSFPNGGGAPNVAQTRNTDTTTDINVGTYTDVPMTGVTDMIDAAWFTVVGDGIRCLKAGRVKVTASVHMTSVAQRTNVNIRVAVGGVGQGGTGGSSYIRSASGHNEASSHITRYVDVSANDVITIEGAQEGIAGTVTLTDGGSVLLVEQW